MKGNKKIKKGFTLIELLVVIAIIAILSVVVILTLNPAELLRQSRDSNRISDLSVTKSAISFYLASVSTPALGQSGYCYTDAAASTSAGSATSYSTTTCGAWFPQASGTAVTLYSSSTAVDSTGWIPIAFSTSSANQIPGGSPLGALPHDPVNNNGWNFYSYEASTTSNQFKLDAHMESQKYSLNGPNDVVSTDGGVDPNSYEVGTNLKM
jgi:prepilin-type N-terminal cleavage/methylation domain-containing protein